MKSHESFKKGENLQSTFVYLWEKFLVGRIFAFFMVLPVVVAAQPNGYYNNALGLNGAALRTALHTIIMNHNSVGYSALWGYYQQTDAKPNGKVWDIYSDKPGQTPPYQYTFVSDQCGNYNSEGECYNREHTYPQSYFNSTEPMKSDMFQVYPTDGYVNGKRSNYMYGVVTNPTYTSQNGSELGQNTYPGSPSGIAFEPIDSFKGDLARTYFYIATRYKGEDNGWSDWEMANGAELKQWTINMLLEWNHNDPVSEKEIDRNNAIYSIQNNRNPFIDYPVFADCIWGTANCSSLTVTSIDAQYRLNIYPNPAISTVRINWKLLEPDETVALDVMNLQGQIIWHKTETAKSVENISVANWAKGVYILKLQTQKGTALRKIVVE